MTEVPENRVPFVKPEGYNPGTTNSCCVIYRPKGQTSFFPTTLSRVRSNIPGLGYRPYIVIMPNLKTDMNSKGAVSSDFIGFNYDYPEATMNARTNRRRSSPLPPRDDVVPSQRPSRARKVPLAASDVGTRQGRIPR